MSDAIPATTDEFAAWMYERMKAQSPVCKLYDSIRAASSSEEATALIIEAPKPLQAELIAFRARRAELITEHGEYAETVHAREEWSSWCRLDPKTRWGALKRYYANGHIGQMIDDWGWIEDPSRANKGKSVQIPLRLWKRQFELIDWMWKHFRDETPAVCAKSRDVGCSWVAMAFCACLCSLFKKLRIGVVASDEDKLDSRNDPNPTLPKAREFMLGCPPELRAGFDGTTETAPYLKVLFPETKSIMRGWTGRGNQGRGGRAALTIVDESAFFVESVDASLSAVSGCRLDFSSANGTADKNNFYAKVSSGEFDTFYFTIDHDPRKDAAWQKEKQRITDPVIWASEYKIDFVASIDMQLFEWKWVEASIGLLELLKERDNFENPGNRRAALDVSDQGKDMNCLTISTGVLLEWIELWSGAGSNQSETCARAFAILDERGGCRELVYDASVAGAGIPGAARALNDKRGKKVINLLDFVGGSTHFPNPEAMVMGTDRVCKDFFANLKAFAYWGLRQRFIESWKARNGEPYDPELIICIDPELPHLVLLKNELAQIQRKYSPTDKLVIDKAAARLGKPQPKSPNCADSLSMCMGGAAGAGWHNAKWEDVMEVLSSAA